MQAVAPAVGPANLPATHAAQLTWEVTGCAVPVAQLVQADAPPAAAAYLPAAQLVQVEVPVTAA